MISTAVIDEIQRLLGEGRLSQRKIARQIGVSRGTVNAIAMGKRIDSARREGVSGDGFVPPRGRAKRCPGCGGMVKMPCLLCFIRKQPTAQGRNRDRSRAVEPGPW